MNEYYGVASTPTEDFLAHYGVKGMHWGVRKYINKDGSFSNRSLSRYGKNTIKKTSAHKMAYDHNMMNQKIANLNADKVDFTASKKKYENKIDKKTNKFLSKYPDANKNTVRKNIARKYSKKIDQINANINTANKYMNGIKNVQKGVLQNAKKNNYDIVKKDATWYGMSHKGRGQMATAGYLGGAVGSGITAASLMKNKDYQYKAPAVKMYKKTRR